VTFPLDHISEPCASVLLFVCVHDLLLRLRSLLHLLRSFLDSAFITTQAYGEDNR